MTPYLTNFYDISLAAAEMPVSNGRRLGQPHITRGRCGSLFIVICTIYPLPVSQRALRSYPGSGH